MTKFVCFILGLPTWWLRGYVLSILWRWFAVPLGMPAIGVSVSIGFCLLLGLAMASPSKAARRTSRSSVRRTP